ncbi:hypothetical protein BYT27DRAFT_7207571 [Phlegmacium glaucopus]|nr:hypothetical protein BYT27DRAFT_7207571 [Phlegmacium glaucopus]
MPKKSTVRSRRLLRQQYGSRYIPDSNPSTPGETESESDSGLEAWPNSESQVPSSMISEHEIPVPLRPSLESEIQPESQVSHYSPYCQHTDSETFTLPSAVKEFRDMFEGRSNMFNKDFPALLADSEDDGDKSFKGCEMIKEEKSKGLNQAYSDYTTNSQDYDTT